MHANAMAVTIGRHGLLQPILVRELHDQYGYEVVVGERRLRACKIAGLQNIPCIIMGDLDQEQLLEMMLIENLQREDLTPFEEIKVVKALRKFGLTHREISARCGMSHGKAGDLVYISEHLPEEYQRMIVSGRTRKHNPHSLTLEKAKLIARADLPPDELKNIIDLIVEEGVTSLALSKKLAEKPKEKIKRVLSYASKKYWLQLVRPLKDYARSLRDNCDCELEEWEDATSRHLRLTVSQAKDLSEEENLTSLD